ncbi:MAG: hypothetical protein EHM61_19080 [Acidobacteria bacterium]|nr:MAG: hypothetical protein EHM61_19080 [Acidobacteriota bacterium]
MEKYVFYSAVLLALTGISWGQTPAPAAPAPTPEPAASGPLAEMKGYRLTPADFDLLLKMLPSVNPQTLTAPQKQQLVKNWMQVVAFSEEALAQGLDKEPGLDEQIEMFKKRLLFERYQKHLLSQVEVSEEEVRKFYEENRSSYQVPGQVRVSRILLPTKEKADEVRRALSEGVPFEQLAKERSTDGVSKEQGGDLGWVKPGHKEPDLERMAQALEPNQISEPFATNVGWQVIKVTDKRPAVQKEYADVQKVIQQQLTVKKQREVLEAAANDMFKKYDVKIHNAP